MICGVYQISISDYYYFGSAEDCEKRCEKQHLQQLKRGKHVNKKMQEVFNKHKTFSWEVVEDCDDRGMAYAVEQRYIDANFGRKHCLNLNAIASKPPSWKGKPGPNKGKKMGPPSEETKEKISKTLTGRKIGPMSEETKRKQSESHKGKPLPKSQCPHCGIWCAAVPMVRFHGDRCKKITENNCTLSVVQ